MNCIPEPTQLRVPIPVPVVTEKWCNSFLIMYPVSYRYNGGMVVKGKWYGGYEVPRPRIPTGFTLVDIGVGLQLNASPPLATAYLKPEDGRKVKKRELQRLLRDACWGQQV